MNVEKLTALIERFKDFDDEAIVINSIQLAELLKISHVIFLDKIGGLKNRCYKKDVLNIFNFTKKELNTIKIMIANNQLDNV